MDLHHKKVFFVYVKAHAQYQKVILEGQTITTQILIYQLHIKNNNNNNNDNNNNNNNNNNKILHKGNIALGSKIKV